MAHETKFERRKRRVSHHVFSKTDREYVISVRKTNKYIYAQLDSVKEGKTLTGLSSRSVAQKKYNKEIAKQFGVKFGELLKEKFSADLSVAFNRGGTTFHGCIKEFAEGARTAGLKF